MIVDPPVTPVYRILEQEIDRLVGHLVVNTGIEFVGQGLETIIGDRGIEFLGSEFEAFGRNVVVLNTLRGAGKSHIALDIVNRTRLEEVPGRTFMTTIVGPAGGAYDYIQLVVNPGRMFWDVSRTPSENAARIIMPKTAYIEHESIVSAIGVTTQAEAPAADAKVAAERREKSERAVAAADDLRKWLDVTVDEVAKLTGASGSAIFYWDREGGSPRPRTARNLFRLHALVRSLKDAIAPTPPIAVLRNRDPRSNISAYELLEKGQYEQAEELLRPMIFSNDRGIVDRWNPRRVDIEREDTGTPQPERQLKLSRPQNRARRVRLAKQRDR